MARRHQRRSKKYLGNRSHGAGNIKNRRGRGSQGGTGRAGYHKHKWFHTIKYELEAIRKRQKGFTNQAARKSSEISLEQIAKQIGKNAFQKTNDGTFIVSLKDKNIKVIGNGSFTYKAQVTASAFTKSAKEKIEKAGGTAVEA